MEDHFYPQFFRMIGEIWRDLTAIEFLMRAAISRHDGDTHKFPIGPYHKGDSFKEYPLSFGHYSFEVIVEKFKKRFPNHLLPTEELINLRNGMAHGLMAEIGNSHVPQLIKFKEDKSEKVLSIELSIELSEHELLKIQQKLNLIRRSLAPLVSD